MNRRTFVRNGVATGLAASGLAVAAQADEGRPVKVVGVACSPRKGMTTAVAVQAALEAAAAVDERIQTQFIDLGGMSFSGWTATGTFEPDDFGSEVLPVFGGPVPAGLIIGSPVYFRCLSSLCMAFLERLGALRSPRLTLEGISVGVLSVGAYRNGGQELVIAQIQAAMLCHEARIVGGKPAAHQGATLWNAAANRDDILKDEFGIDSARKLGIRVAEDALHPR